MVLHVKKIKIESISMCNLTKITNCEICGNNILLPLLKLGAQPMCDDLIPIGSDLSPQNYKLNLVGCSNCISVHQEYQVPKTKLFPNSYHYRAAMTKDVLAGMKDLVDTVEQHARSLEGKQVLDIGCNDGSLLAIFKQRGAIACGIEPTGAAEDARPRVDWLHNGYFDEQAAKAYLAEFPAPDIITFTNVFAHIEDLNELLDNLKLLLSPMTLIVVENHYLGSVVELAQFDTFYHEHPRTYSYRSFEFIAEKLGRHIESVEFPDRYNGNIRVIMGQGTPVVAPEIDESGYLDGVAKMQAVIAEGKDKVRNKLKELAEQYGPLPAKALPGRAVIIVHCFDLDESLIDATYERTGSPKIGHYIPGTTIEIKDEVEFFETRMSSPVMINLAWHIQAEIKNYMDNKGYTGTVLPIWE